MHDDSLPLPGPALRQRPRAFDRDLHPRRHSGGHVSVLDRRLALDLEPQPNADAVHRVRQRQPAVRQEHVHHVLRRVAHLAHRHVLRARRRRTQRVVDVPLRRQAALAAPHEAPPVALQHAPLPRQLPRARARERRHLHVAHPLPAAVLPAPLRLPRRVRHRPRRPPVRLVLHHVVQLLVEPRRPHHAAGHEPACRRVAHRLAAVRELDARRRRGSHQLVDQRRRRHRVLRRHEVERVQHHRLPEHRRQRRRHALDRARLRHPGRLAQRVPHEDRRRAVREDRRVPRLHLPAADRLLRVPAAPLVAVLRQALAPRPHDRHLQLPRRQHDAGALHPGRRLEADAHGARVPVAPLPVALQAPDDDVARPDEASRPRQAVAPDRRVRRDLPVDHVVPRRALVGELLPPLAPALRVHARRLHVRPLPDRQPKAQLKRPAAGQQAVLLVAPARHRHRRHRHVVPVADAVDAHRLRAGRRRQRRLGVLLVPPRVALVQRVGHGAQVALLHAGREHDPRRLVEVRRRDGHGDRGVDDARVDVAVGVGRRHGHAVVAAGRVERRDPEQRVSHLERADPLQRAVENPGRQERRRRERARRRRRELRQQAPGAPEAAVLGDRHQAPEAAERRADVQLAPQLGVQVHLRVLRELVVAVPAQAPDLARRHGGVRQDDAQRRAVDEAQAPVVPGAGDDRLVASLLRRGAPGQRLAVGREPDAGQRDEGRRVREDGQRRDERPHRPRRRAAADGGQDGRLVVDAARLVLGRRVVAQHVVRGVVQVPGRRVRALRPHRLVRPRRLAEHGEEAVALDRARRRQAAGRRRAPRPAPLLRREVAGADGARQAGADRVLGDGLVDRGLVREGARHLDVPRESLGDGADEHLVALAELEQQPVAGGLDLHVGQVGALVDGAPAEERGDEGPRHEAEVPDLGLPRGAEGAGADLGEDFGDERAPEARDALLPGRQDAARELAAVHERRLAAEPVHDVVAAAVREARRRRLDALELGRAVLVEQALQDPEVHLGVGERGVGRDGRVAAGRAGGDDDAGDLGRVADAEHGEQGAERDLDVLEEGEGDGEEVARLEDVEEDGAGGAPAAGLLGPALGGEPDAGALPGPALGRRDDDPVVADGDLGVDRLLGARDEDAAGLQDVVRAAEGEEAAHALAAAGHERDAAERHVAVHGEVEAAAGVRAGVRVSRVADGDGEGGRERDGVDELAAAGVVRPHGGGEGVGLDHLRRADVGVGHLHGDGVEAVLGGPRAGGVAPDDVGHAREQELEGLEHEVHAAHLAHDAAEDVVDILAVGPHLAAIGEALRLRAGGREGGWRSGGAALCVFVRCTSLWRFFPSPRGSVAVVSPGCSGCRRRVCRCTPRVLKWSVPGARASDRAVDCAACPGGEAVAVIGVGLVWDSP